MRNRDKSILDDLMRFRCLSRDDIAAIHFNRNKAAVKACNEVMRRLRDRGEVEVITSTTPFVYTRKPSPLKKDSQKIQHYRSIVSVYLEMRRITEPRIFQVEPRYGGKGTIEPDIFAFWANKTFLIEVQRSVYSKGTWEEKFGRYYEYFRSGSWRQESWQPVEKKVFPFIWILSDSHVPVPPNLPFPVMQNRSINEFLSSKIKTAT